MATDTTGRFIPDDAPETATYNADGTVATITKTWQSSTWIWTFGYTSGNLTSSSGWVPQ